MGNEQRAKCRDQRADRQIADIADGRWQRTESKEQRVETA
jgi:hypothetical protein